VDTTGHWGRHLKAPDTELLVYSGQGEQEVEPELDDTVPLGHTTQDAMEVAPPVVLYVPAGQAVHTFAPAVL
jgi:hypothetical protein